MVHILECHALLAVSELHVTNSFPLLIRIPEVNEMPFSQVIQVFHRLINIRVAFTIHVIIWVSSISVYSTIAITNPKCQVAVAKFKVVAIRFLII
jgi:hypothetical protein